MYSRLYKYLNDQKILHPQQLGFWKGHSNEHLIPQFVDQIYESFENDNCTVGIFVNLSKAFDIVDYTMLLKKLKIYGIAGANLAWFRSYLKNREQYICINNDNNDLCTPKYSMYPKDLLFLIYVNDLPSASNLLNAKMFVHDANLFFEHKDISVLFSTVNREFQNITEWFT